MKYLSHTLAVLLLVGACVDTSDEAAWLARADEARKSAESAEQLGMGTSARDEAVARAADSIARLLDEHPPADLAPAHAHAVQQDLAYTLAMIRLEQERLPEALQACDRGLAIDEAHTVFAANLYIARGRAHEELEQPQAAAADYYSALRINEELMNEALGGQR